jgi:hypothetical protein
MQGIVLGGGGGLCNVLALLNLGNIFVFNVKVVYHL